MSFNDLPIRRKVIGVTMLTSGIALMVATFAFMAYEIHSFRQSHLQNVEAVAQLTAADSAAALMFFDEAAATQNLRLLATHQFIKASALYDREGKIFAKYPTNAGPDLIPARPLMPGVTFERNSINLFVNVEAETQAGILFVRSDMSPVSERYGLYAAIMLGVFGGAFLVALLLSNILQRKISDPILELAKTAQAVRQKNDYGVRATKFGNDELGQLTDAFNQMLQQIHDREAALRDSEERLRLSLDASRMGVFDWNIQTGHVSADEQLYRLFGRSKSNSDPTFDSLMDLVHPEDRDELRKTVETALSDKKDFAFQFRVIWPNETVHYLASRGRGVYDALGKPYRLAGVALDITHLKEAEHQIKRLNTELEKRVATRTAQLEETNRELEAFTYSVSHDLRAPLRHINAYAEILESDFGDVLPGEVKSYTQRIRHGTRTMGKLVDDLLNLARVGRLEISRQAIDLNAVVAEVIGELQNETAGRKIHWRIAPLPSTPCDPGLIKQVFVNLLNNAVKYTKLRAEAVIEVNSYRKDNETVFFVRDNGVGFEMKYSDKLFGVFQRLHRPEDFEGSGVGLAIVHRIIRKHSGRIWAESEVDKGSTFYFTLGT